MKLRKVLKVSLLSISLLSVSSVASADDFYTKFMSLLGFSMTSSSGPITPDPSSSENRSGPVTPDPKQSDD